MLCVPRVDVTMLISEKEVNTANNDRFKKETLNVIKGELSMTMKNIVQLIQKRKNGAKNEYKFTDKKGRPPRRPS